MVSVRGEFGSGFSWCVFTCVFERAFGACGWSVLGGFVLCACLIFVGAGLNWGCVGRVWWIGGLVLLLVLFVETLCIVLWGFSILSMPALPGASAGVLCLCLQSCGRSFVMVGWGSFEPGVAAVGLLFFFLLFG